MIIRREHPVCDLIRNVLAMAKEFQAEDLRIILRLRETVIGPFAY